MPRSVEHELVLQFLGYEWVNLEELYTKLSGKIQPGVAVREYMKIFNLGKAKATGEGPAKGPLPEKDQIRSGARALLREAVRSATQSGSVQRKQVGDTVYVRRNNFSAEEVDNLLAQRVAEARSEEHTSELQSH